MTNRRIDFSSAKTFAGLAFSVIVILVVLLSLEYRNNQQAQNQDLRERAEASAARIASNVSPSVWSLYQRPDDNSDPEQIASQLLDSELLADFEISAQVYGNFGHLLLGRLKLASGDIISLRNADDIEQYYSNLSKVRRPVREGPMTIGHIVVQYDVDIHREDLLAQNVQTTIFYSLFALLLIIALYLLMRASTENKLANKAYYNLEATQEQLIQSEKLASLGNLVAGIAHEINTPIGVAVTSSSLISELTTKVAKQIEANALTRESLTNYLADVQESSDMSNRSLRRVVNLVSNFKHIAADQNVEEERYIHLLAYIDEVISTLSVEMKRHNCTVQVVGDRDLKLLTIPGLIAQIITNLVTNSMTHAFQGMDQGKMRISVSQQDNDDIELMFSDNGQGMPADVLDRIFEPFYTTKRGRGGTGLGMHIVYNIIRKRLKGEISVTSTVGKGTEFTLRFPPFTPPDEHTPETIRE